MLSKSKSSGHTTSFSSSAGTKKKKPAPPRPPLPSTNRMQSSQSFSTGSELKNRASGHRSMSVAGRSDFGSDLIDFNTPLESVQKSQANILSVQEPPDFKYRVGASIFFIKSPLVNSVSNSSTKSAHPFSPPRPSAQALSKSSNPSATTSASYNKSSTATSVATKYFSQPTIIKSQQASVEVYQSTSSSQNKGISTTATNHVPTTTNLAATHPYSNIPLEWDEPPKKFTSTTPAYPTIIKPQPPPKKPGLGSKVVQPTLVPNTFAFAGQTVSNEAKPYYDEPPDFDDFDDDDDDDDDFISKPMPDEPPPPPPPNDVEEWIDGTDKTPASDYGIYSEPHDKAVGMDRAYAIALYDYTPEADGDLALQAGDLIYLTKKIDESWLYGTCGGLEGMFPSNYVNVAVPLPEENDYAVPEELNSQSATNEQQFVNYYANIDYDFAAETESDLNLQAGTVVTILGRINEDWLYGEVQGSRGQFPAAFVSPVPLDLPTLTF